jgi:Zn-finger nucleic acid-binding protein
MICPNCGEHGDIVSYDTCFRNMKTCTVCNGVWLGDDYERMVIYWQKNHKEIKNRGTNESRRKN